MTLEQQPLPRPRNLAMRRRFVGHRLRRDVGRRHRGDIGRRRVDHIGYAFASARRGVGRLWVFLHDRFHCNSTAGGPR